MSALLPKADIVQHRGNVCFSNRAAGVKRFQTVHGCGVNVTRGLVLLSGIGTSALPAWDPRTRWNNLEGDLAVGRSKRTHELTSSIVPRGTSFHRFVELEFPPVVIRFYIALMALRLPWSNETQCHQPRCGA